MVNYKIQHITNKRKIIRNMNPTTLTIHSTGNLKSTAQNERDNLNRPGNTSSTGFHVVVDDKQAIECIPFNKVAYHAGDGANGKGNNTSIGLEICESGNRQKTLENAVKTTAKILKEKGWGVSQLRRHFDWSGKSCPRILMANNWAGWNKFKQDVQVELNKSKKKAKTYMSRGDVGNNVKKLQQDLILLGYSFGKYGADGSFGLETERVVQQFQRDNKLVVDGFAGQATQARIKKLLNEMGDKKVTTKNNDKPSTWAKDAWEWAKKEGYMDGKRPHDNVTRQELAIVIKRIIESV